MPVFVNGVKFRELPSIIRRSRRADRQLNNLGANEMRVLRVVVILLGLALLGLAGYAYFGDMDADPTEMRVPVELDLADPAANSTTPGAGTSPAGAEPTDGADGAD